MKRLGASHSSATAAGQTARAARNLEVGVRLFRPQGLFDQRPPHTLFTGASGECAMREALAEIGEPLYANRVRSERLPRLGGSGNGSGGRRVTLTHEETNGSLLEVTTKTDQSTPHDLEIRMWISRLLDGCVPYRPTYPLQFTVDQVRADIRVLGRRRTVQILSAGSSWVCTFRVGGRRVDLFGRQFDPLDVDVVRLTSTQIESIQQTRDEWLASLDSLSPASRAKRSRPSIPRSSQRVADQSDAS